MEKRFPVLLDTSQVMLDKEGPDLEDWQGYHFLYLGPYKDSVEINYSLLTPDVPVELPLPPGSNSETNEEFNEKVMRRRRNNPLYPFFVENAYERKTKYCTTEKVRIDIDTTQVIGSASGLFYASLSLRRAYPVMLTNETKDTIQICYGNYIPLIMEARDRNGKWKPIENLHHYFCGFGIGYCVLPPQYIALTSAIIYKGGYRTQMRLRLGNNYSKIFMGQMDHSQFDRVHEDNL